LLLARKQSFYALIEQFWFVRSWPIGYARRHERDYVLQREKDKLD
jgi:hypothetical protein